AEEKFQRKVVNAFCILLLVGGLGFHPALSEDVTNRVCKRFEAFPGTGYFWVDCPIKNQMSFVEPILCAGKFNCIGTVLLKKLRNAVLFRRHGDDSRGIWLSDGFCAHSRTSQSCSSDSTIYDFGGGRDSTHGPTWRSSSHRRTAGRERLCS